MKQETEVNSGVNVGIIGFGTVGAGTVEVLMQNRELIRSRVGTDIHIRRIADLDLETDRGIAVDPQLLTGDALAVVEDPAIDIVVELMGGLDAARRYILRAMELGKDVVTANKALLAEHGQEIFAAAVRHGVQLGYEASVGGGIPIIGAMRRGLSANRISKLMGILNGTSNYILTRMAIDGFSYRQAVEEAIRLGYAEDPPDLDVEGVDAAHKLAILLSIALGCPIPFAAIHKEGITALTPDDLRFADEFGFRVKLLAIASQKGSHLEARVHPAMIPRGHILAKVNDVFNAVYIEGDFVGPSLFFGLGAGRRPTGSAVVSDIMDLARQRLLKIKGLMPPLADTRPADTPVSLQPMEDLVSAYYFRFSVVDRPGVLSKIAGILGEHDISIAQVIQQGRQSEGSVPVVMLTHEAPERNMRQAVRRIDELDMVTARTVVIRVES